MSLLIQTFKVFINLLSEEHQNAISDLHTKFQLILTSTFGHFQSESLELLLGCKINF